MCALQAFFFENRGPLLLSHCDTTDDALRVCLLIPHGPRCHQMIGRMSNLYDVEINLTILRSENCPRPVQVLVDNNGSCRHYSKIFRNGRSPLYPATLAILSLLVGMYLELTTISDARILLYDTYILRNPLQRIMYQHKILARPSAFFSDVLRMYDDLLFDDATYPATSTGSSPVDTKRVAPDVVACPDTTTSLPSKSSTPGLL